MVTHREIPISFPFGGVDRRSTYQQHPPKYTTPASVNVLPVDQVRRRRRGGMRPGIETITKATLLGGGVEEIIISGSRGSADLIVIGNDQILYLSADSIAGLGNDLLTESEEQVLTESEQWIDVGVAMTTSEYSGSAYMPNQGIFFVSDGVLYRGYGGIAEPVVAVDDGEVPTNISAITAWRDRLIVASGAYFYMSRSESYDKWALMDDANDTERAFAGHIGRVGEIGGVIKAMIPVSDDSLIFMTDTHIWQMTGDPCDNGTTRLISDEIGIVKRDAFCVVGDVIYWVDDKGLYRWAVGSRSLPENLTDEILPYLTDGDNDNVCLIYDPNHKAIHFTLNSVQWWYDVASGSFWQVSMPASWLPVSAVRYAVDDSVSSLEDVNPATSDLWNQAIQHNDVIFVGQDGNLRRFNYDAVQDDAIDIKSALILGPFSLSTGIDLEAMVMNLRASCDGNVNWYLFTGSLASDVADNAIRGLGLHAMGLDVLGYVESGTCNELPNRMRRKGQKAAILLTSTSGWGFNTLKLDLEQFERR